MEQYFYLIWCLIFFGVWLLLFLYRKDVRREMLSISLLFGLGGLLSEKTNIIDWWRPLTITNTRIGFEDFIIGFCIGGVASIIYEEIYSRHLSRRNSNSSGYNQTFIFLLGFAVFYLALFYIFLINSFYSSVVTYLIFTAYILLKRKDLIRDSLFSGLWMLVIGIGIYFLLFFVYPGYIQRFWLLPKHWYSTLFFGVPLGEYVWYFLTGAYIGPLYAFIKKAKLVKNSI